MGARILVADDSVTIQKVVELTFSKEDFQLIQARSGEEAVRKAKGERPDLVLLDLVMPDKNGYEVCQALRADPTLRGVPIILLAGTFESFDKERAAAAGANDFVAKPFESQALVSKVKQLLFARTLDGGARPAPPAAPAPPDPALEKTEEAAPAESQDQLWQLLDQPQGVAPAPLPSAAPVDLSAIEDGGVDLDLDLDRLAQPSGETTPLPEMDLVTAPGSLSLDDLLGAETAPTSATPASEATPVFELPEEDLPSLPLVEARETGMPADELASVPGGVDVARSPQTDGPAPPDAADLDFAALTENLEPGPVELAPDTEASDLALPSLDLSVEGGEAGAEPAALEELPAVETAAEQRPLEPPAPAPAEPPSDALTPDTPLPASEELMAMRHEVAARVSEQLAKDLSQVLVDRIEQVVWEVVPDLAEVLILKEIARIKQLADEQKSS
jgi:CheY-like chemotaxis protein